MPTFYTASFISSTLNAANTLKSDMTAPSSAKPGIPDREVTKDEIIFNKFPKIGTYYVTKAEYLNLSASSLVDAQQLIPTQEDLNKYTITSSLIESTITGSYRSGQSSAVQGDLGENAIAWTLPYHSSVDPNNLYSGSGGSYTIDKYLSSEKSPLNPTKYNYVLDGTGVDLIAMDSQFYKGHNHADFYNKKGKTRVQYVNWNELVSEDGTDPPYVYRLLKSVATVPANHGMMLASTAAGLLSGFAKNANIYLMPTRWGLQPQSAVFSFDVAANLIIKFHQSKSIDTNTGYKRPTVAVISQASMTNFQTMARAGNTFLGPFSASFELNIGANEGIRFAHINKNYIFVSSSTTSTYAQPLDRNLGTQDFKGTHSTWFVWKFNGGLDSLITSINSSSLNSYLTPFSASYNSSILSITSSFPQMTRAGNPIPNQSEPVSIYTGSFNPNNNFRPNTTGTTEDTGSFINYLGSPSELPNHINSIVNNGVERANISSNNNILTSDTFSYNQSPKDLWGNSPINSGPLGGNNDFYWENGVCGDSFDIWQPVHEAICQEMADAGVIFVKSGGNRGGLISQTGSTVDAPYFNENCYDVNLANNYFTLDVDQGTFGIAGEKIYYNRAQPSNGSAIIVGNGPIKQSTPIQSIKSSIGFPLLQPAPSSNRGAGIDVWAPSKNIIHACPRDGLTGAGFPSSPSNIFPAGYGRSTTNHALLKNMTIDPSVDDTISSSFNSLYNAGSAYYNRKTFSKSFTKESGGTSVAAPIIAGLICCWLQINPWANIKDVRNFIQSMPNSFPNSTIPFSTKKYLSGYIDIDATGSKINKLVSESQHYQMGINANLMIGHLPFSTPSPVSFSNIFTGSFSLSNFSLT